MLCHLCCKTDVSGGGPVPEKSQFRASSHAQTRNLSTQNPPKPLPAAESIPEKSTTDKISVATHHLWDYGFIWRFCWWKANLRGFILSLLSPAHSFLCFPTCGGGSLSVLERLIHSLVLLLTARVMQVNKQRKTIREEGWERVSVRLDHFTEPVLSMVTQTVELLHLSTNIGGEDGS